MKSPKQKTFYICNNCGAKSPRWQGQCHVCKEWNTLKKKQEVTKVELSQNRVTRVKKGFAGSSAKAIRVSDIVPTNKTVIKSSIGEFDRVLGGGIVRGSVTLIGGDPGIGKSSILLQILATISQSQKVLYVSGEESLEQISLRARRMAVPVDNLLVMCETNVEKISSYINEYKPEVVVIDSIQTMYSPEVSSMAGGVSQVRESSVYFTQIAKALDVAVFLVGHVTKTGEVAGPRVLEHIVDTVVLIESQADGRYRIMRALKNRFGAVNEIGVFAMTKTGMKEVKNPSAIFLSTDRKNTVGSAIVSLWEGTRPLLVEIQSLVVAKEPSMPARRLAIGLDNNRLAMIIAIIKKYLNINLYDNDIFINIVGGVKIVETSIDLALIAVIISSIQEKPLSDKLLIMGEVGLSGEVRPVPYGVERIKEAIKHGFKKIIVPKANSKSMRVEDIDIVCISSISDLLAALR